MIVIVLVIVITIITIISSEILLATDNIPSLFIDGPQNGSIYLLRSNINESNIIIRYRLDDIHYVNDSSYDICITIKRYSDRYLHTTITTPPPSTTNANTTTTSVINYCTPLHDSIVFNTLNITNLVAGDYTIAFELKTNDDDDDDDGYCRLPYFIEPLVENVVISTVLFSIKKFIDEVSTIIIVIIIIIIIIIIIVTNTICYY